MNEKQLNEIGSMLEIIEIRNQEGMNKIDFLTGSLTRIHQGNGSLAYETLEGLISFLHSVEGNFEYNKSDLQELAEALGFRKSEEGDTP